MKKCLSTLFVVLLLMTCKEDLTGRQYRVTTKDSANFSIILPEILPKERMIVKINDEVIEDITGKDSLGNPSSWRYYKYPLKITHVEFINYYLGTEKIRKEFNDTLEDIPQRTLIVTRPFPQGMTKLNWRRYGFVSIDTGMRSITLVNDAVEFKGTWTDKVR